jgi:hypothetical protein
MDRLVRRKAKLHAGKRTSTRTTRESRFEGRKSFNTLGSKAATRQGETALNSTHAQLLDNFLTLLTMHAG